MFAPYCREGSKKVPSTGNYNVLDLSDQQGQSKADPISLGRQQGTLAGGLGPQGPQQGHPGSPGRGSWPTKPTTRARPRDSPATRQATRPSTTTANKQHTIIATVRIPHHSSPPSPPTPLYLRCPIQSLSQLRHQPTTSRTRYDPKRWRQLETRTNHLFTKHIA